MKTEPFYELPKKPKRAKQTVGSVQLFNLPTFDIFLKIE